MKKPVQDAKSKILSRYATPAINVKKKTFLAG